MGGTLYRVTSRSCSWCPTGQRQEEHTELWAGPRGRQAASGYVPCLSGTVCPVPAEPSPGACHLGSGLSLHPPSAPWVGIYTAVGGSGLVFSLLLPVLALSLAFPPGQQ